MSVLSTRSPVHAAALIGIALFFAAGAVGHFLLVSFFVAIVPDYIPAPHRVVAVSGVCELAGAVGILVPATRWAAGIGLLAFIVAVFPANVNMAMHPVRFAAFPAWLLYARLPLQAVLLAWVLFAMRRRAADVSASHQSVPTRAKPAVDDDLSWVDEVFQHGMAVNEFAQEASQKPAVVTGRVHEIAANTRGRDYMVGDIHGHFFLLERVLAHIGFEPERDRLFSVGDLIDRGPESHRAVEFLDLPWFHAIRGNHEQMLLDALRPGVDQARDQDLWRMNGGDWFDALEAQTATAIHERVARLPHAFDIEMAGGGRAGLIHADVFRNSWQATRRLLAKADDDASGLYRVVWGRHRARAIHSRLSGIKSGRVGVAGIDLVAFGHTPMPVALACANTRWLDTGAFDDGRLTVAEIAVDGAVCSLDALHGTFHSEWHWLDD